MVKPIVWTIAGSDSGGGAGIQADLHAIHALGAYPCSVITALTAQNSYAVHHVEFPTEMMIAGQIQALAEDLPAAAIKLGMLGTQRVMQIITTFLKNFSGPVICDPVMVATCGAELFDRASKSYFIQHIIPYANLLTPNILEVESLLDQKIQSAENIERAAKKLLAMGCKNVLIKGGHTTGDYCQDYWTDGVESAWLTIERRQHTNNHGTGCTLSSAIAAAMALNYSMLDAIVIAKAYVSQGLRVAEQYGQGPGPVAHDAWPEQQQDLPWITTTAESGIKRLQYLPCTSRDLGFYPIVDSFEWVQRLLPLGVKTIQLRIKDKKGAALEEDIKQSILLAREHQAQLFINDYWEFALKHGAYGVHLGQEDLQYANGAAIAKAGIRLGISTHSYTEVARAHALQPSYIACGPIYPTTSKIMPFAPQGLLNLKRWRRTLNYPLVAIGGISLERLPAVQATGIDGVAVISALTQAKDPDQAAKAFLNSF